MCEIFRNSKCHSRGANENVLKVVAAEQLVQNIRRTNKVKFQATETRGSKHVTT